LDVYERDNRLECNSRCKGAAIFQDARGSTRLALPPGKLGSVRIVINDRSPGVSRGLQNLVNICVEIEPLS
jgi:hypothetical protein